MPDRTAVLVTVHGIGFQQAPLGGNPGYADDLHRNLAGFLPDLSDDPGPPVRNGPIYVQSHWPPDTNDREAGLKRLGSWKVRADRIVDITNAPLVVGNAKLAHVALVYSHLEDQGLHPGSAPVWLTSFQHSKTTSPPTSAATTCVSACAASSVRRCCACLHETT